ncbi:hypothetical protein [Arthrobacter sp. JCM 19049]|uniref:hypothetical protein n=1 Tax=Arthrobacter sp. JCM 19049 TaxID=1460643 RepID=UPI002436851A|nr:hypothetical protein [Arthrobacter sp. JCM 19049]
MPETTFDPAAFHPQQAEFSFQVGTRLTDGEGNTLPGRTGTITTPHADQDPRVHRGGHQGHGQGTNPAQVQELGAQAVLANATTCTCSPGRTSWTPPADWARSWAGRARPSPTPGASR